MKICLDNLEKLRYNPKTEKWYLRKNGFIYMDSCETCGNDFLARVNSQYKYCSYKCMKGFTGRYHRFIGISLNIKDMKNIRKNIRR